MKLRYEWDPSALRIEESADGEDIEFQIDLLSERPYTEAMRQVQACFEANRVHTDVFFYAYPGHRYKVIVRKDFYEDFLLELMRRRLLRALAWESTVS